MAEKAQAEPTMEEILASIRKIISDEGDGSTPAARPAKKPEPSVSVNVAEDDDFEDLSLDDVIERAGGDVEALGEETEDTVDPIADSADSDTLLSDVDESMFEELTIGEDETPSEATAELDEIEEFDLGAVELENDEPMLATQAGPEPAEEDDEWDRDYPATDRAPEPEPAAPEPAMLRGKIESTATKEAESGLTDERIAGAAASALGKLMVKQAAESGETANPNTLEGLMKELLRPMIKEWLDANLPAIVERKVEEEVQRIARMAR